MFLDTHGWWTQEHAWESVPAAMANAMEIRRRLTESPTIPASEWSRLIRENEIAKALHATPVIFPRSM